MEKDKDIELAESILQDKYRLKDLLFVSKYEDKKPLFMLSEYIDESSDIYNRYDLNYEFNLTSVFYSIKGNPLSENTFLFVNIIRDEEEIVTIYLICKPVCRNKDHLEEYTIKIK